MPENISKLTLPTDLPVAHTYAEVSSRLHEIVKSNNGKPPSAEQVKEMLAQLGRLPINNMGKEVIGNVTMGRALEIMGEGHFLGPKEIKYAFKSDIPKKNIPAINFSEQELIYAKELGFSLILRVGEIPEGEALDIDRLQAVWKTRFPVKTDIQLMSSSAVALSERAPRTGWALCGPYVDSIDMSDFSSFPALLDWFNEKINVFVPQTDIYKARVAANQFLDQHPGYTHKADLISLPILNNFLPSLSEVLYDAVLLGPFMSRRTFLTRTNSHSDLGSVQQISCLNIREQRNSGNVTMRLSVFNESNMLSCGSHNVKMVINRYCN